MHNYTSSTYGDRIAGVYDGFYAPTDVSERVDFLEELASGGRALELGVGTGTYALPLAARGVEVHGIDSSSAMVDQLRDKDGGEAMPVTIGDFADVDVKGTFSLVFVDLQHLLHAHVARGANPVLPERRFPPGRVRCLPRSRLRP